MSKQLKLRRGTTVQHASFTGGEGEITVDTTRDTAVVHDGSTVGGHPLLKDSDYRTSTTGSAKLPAGTTAERDGSPVTGYMRFNSTLSKFEGYNGSAWSSVGATDGQDVNFTQSGTGAVERTVTSKLRERVTPQDFGVVGNGIADDTAALQLFFNYINSTVLGGATVGYTGTFGTPTAHIPAAHYVIGGPIALGSYLDVYCDKRAMFTAKAGYTGVLFHSVTPYQIRWSGGIFQASANGAGGIWWMGNANYPTSPINLDQGFCVFEGFEAKGFQDVFPVLVNRSAQMVIKDFKCDRNIHLIGRGTNLNTTTGAYSQTSPRYGYGGYADVIDVGPGWITSSDLMADDFDGVICADSIRTNDLLLVPVPHAGKECAWVNAWASHIATRIRYGGEPGSFAPCNWFGPFSSSYPMVLSHVNIIDSDVYNTDLTSTTLATSIDAVTTTVVLTDGSKFPATGEFVIGAETFRYWSKTGNTFSCLARPSTAQVHTAGDSASLLTGTIIRMFNDAPNLIKITGCSGGTDMKSIVNYSYDFSNYAAAWSHINGLLFKCNISGNNFVPMIGDFVWQLIANTVIDMERVGFYSGTATATGSPGNIRTAINGINCQRVATYRLRMKVNSSFNYLQCLEGLLSINHYYNGGATVVNGSFTKTADIDPPIPGAPSNLDVVAVKFQYPSGSVTASNTAPIADSFDIRPVLDVSASIGGVGGSEILYWELID